MPSKPEIRSPKNSPSAPNRKALADGSANRDLSRHSQLAKAEAAKQFPAAFQQTEGMGWVPEGWEVSTIGEEVDSVGGATPSTKNAEFWDDGDIHWTTPISRRSLKMKKLKI